MAIIRRLAATTHAVIELLASLATDDVLGDEIDPCRTHWDDVDADS